MKETRSEFVANSFLAKAVAAAPAKADWTQPSPNRFRMAGPAQQSLFDRVVKALFPVRGI